MDIKFTVNEFSKIVGISSRNIRYYDDIGLFKSSGTLENGYRYYTIDKIEEIYIINYFRHLGIPIKEIKQHLQNRNIDEYNSILKNQYTKVTEEIGTLLNIQHRIHRRITSLDYIREIPELNTIKLQQLPSRRIIKLDKQIKSQIDWEISLKELDNASNPFPNIFIGDIGFFVDMENVKTREAEEFTGMFLLADDPIYDNSKTTELPSGTWLTIYIRGDHHEARKCYDKLLNYAKCNNISLETYAIERTLIDHYISSDPNLHITEILIPVLT